MFLRGWQGSRSGATREAIRAMHIDGYHSRFIPSGCVPTLPGPAPSGDFWFLLVVSKGTRRRQGIWGDVDVEFGFRLLLQAD